MSTMHFYWTYKSIPELAGLESARQKAICRACRLRPFRHWQTWVAFFGQFIIVLLAAFIGIVLDGRLWMLEGKSPVGRETFQFPWIYMILICVAALGAIVMFGQVYMHMMRRYIKSQTMLPPEKQAV